jgi:hypothetical protein
MSDTDELSAELRELRDYTAEVAVPAAPRLEAITAKGRRLQRRRRIAVTGLAVACAIAATALVLTLASVPRRAHTPASIGKTAPAKIHTAAFTLVSNSDGTVTLTINPVELFEPATLQNDLGQYGIPALVTIGKICSSDPAPAGLSQVESFDPGTPSVDATITIDPSAIPTGSELSFGILDLRDDVQASYFSLIDPSAYTCTSTPPNDADAHRARGGFVRLDPTN